MVPVWVGAGQSFFFLESATYFLTLRGFLATNKFGIIFSKFSFQKKLYLKLEFVFQKNKIKTLKLSKL